LESIGGWWIKDVEDGIQSTLLQTGADGVNPRCEGNFQGLLVGLDVSILRRESLDGDVVNGVDRFEAGRTSRHDCRAGSSQSLQRSVGSSSSGISIISTSYRQEGWESHQWVMG
jgi:hypothetical protein